MLKILKSSLFNLELDIRMTQGWLGLFYQIPKAVGPNSALGSFPLESEFSCAPDQLDSDSLQIFTATQLRQQTLEKQAQWSTKLISFSLMTSTLSRLFYPILLYNLFCKCVQVFVGKPAYCGWLYTAFSLYTDFSRSMEPCSDLILIGWIHSPDASLGAQACIHA